MPDEQSRRRPDFHEESVPITIADRGTWYFPKPWLQLRTKIVDGKPVGVPGRFTFGREFDDLIELVRDEDDPIQRISHVLAVPIFLLRLNYDLSDEELEDLTEFNLGNPDDERWLLQVMAVVSGQAPKA